MKNRVSNKGSDRPKKSRSKTVELSLKIRISAGRSEQFLDTARNLGLTNDQLASAMIDSDMEGDDANPFYEIGYHVMIAATKLYPECRAKFVPVRNAFIDTLESNFALIDARRKAGAV